MDEYNVLKEQAKLFRELANVYDEMAILSICEETEENEEKMQLYLGKVLIIQQKMQNLSK